MVQKVFNRYEKKYLLTYKQYQQVREMLQNHMLEDEFGLHNIRNIYYDTETDELIRTSIEKPKYKEKFRVRCYGNPTKDTPIFLEIKKKYKGIVNKRRVVMRTTEAEDYLLHGRITGENSQILQEISYFIQSYQIQPKLYLAYDRIALYGIEDKEFRVTFDTNIRSRNTNLRLENDEDTTLLMGTDFYLMEVKITNAMPLWFVHILDACGISGISFSKYGTVYKNNVKNGYYDYIQTGRICTC